MIKDIADVNSKGYLIPINKGGPYFQYRVQPGYWIDRTTPAEIYMFSPMSSGTFVEIESRPKIRGTSAEMKPGIVQTDSPQFCYDQGFDTSSSYFLLPYATSNPSVGTQANCVATKENLLTSGYSIWCYPKNSLVAHYLCTYWNDINDYRVCSKNHNSSNWGFIRDASSEMLTINNFGGSNYTGNIRIFFYAIIKAIRGMSSSGYNMNVGEISKVRFKYDRGSDVADYTTASVSNSVIYDHIVSQPTPIGYEQMNETYRFVKCEVTINGNSSKPWKKIYLPEIGWTSTDSKNLFYNSRVDFLHYGMAVWIPNII